MDDMNQTPETTPTDTAAPFGAGRSTITAPAAVRLIGANLGTIARQLRDIEPDEMNRADLLSLLGLIAAGVELSAALLDHNADRLNYEAAERAGVEVAAIMDVIR